MLLLAQNNATAAVGSRRIALASLTRSAQPQFAAQINPGNPITKGLAYIVNPALGIMDNALRTATVNGVSRTVSQKGYVLSVSGNNAALGASFASSPLVTSTGNGSGDFTFFVYSNPKAIATHEIIIFAQTPVSGEAYIVANANAALGVAAGSLAYSQYNGAASTGLTAAGAVDGAYHLFVYTRTADQGALYSDGKLLASGTVTTGAVSYSGSAGKDIIGGYVTAGWGISGDVPLAGAFNRGLTAAEVKQLSDNPWQVFL